jgi:hypothetical protein
MAISRGAGTEIIRTIMLNDVDDTWRNLIFGEQHHIYTVLSIIVYAQAVSASGNFIQGRILGYDSLTGTTAEDFYLFKHDMSVPQTFVWNDKFSFNGHEPTDFTGPVDDATKQNAIADQGSSVAQKLQIVSENASDNFNVVCTYIDQNNA